MPLPLPDPQLPGNPQDALQSIQRNFEALAQALTAPSEWASVSYVNNFADYGSPYAAVGYYKDPFGRVHLRGAMEKTSGSAPASAFTLPAGFRPTETEAFLVLNSPTLNRSAVLVIAPSGTVTMEYLNATAFISLSGVSFRAA